MRKVVIDQAADTQQRWAIIPYGPLTALAGVQLLRERVHTTGVGSSEIVIMGEDGTECPVGDVGLVYARDTTSAGIAYRNDPEKTAGAHLAPRIFTLGDHGHRQKTPRSLGTPWPRSTGVASGQSIPLVERAGRCPIALGITRP